MVAQFHALPRWDEGDADYRYRGVCPLTSSELCLGRTRQARQLALRIADELPALTEGKMFGVLLVRHGSGQIGYGKAFSGLLEGEAVRPGWVPPAHVATPTVSEASTLKLLAEWKERLGQLHDQILAHPYPTLAQRWDDEENALRERQRQAKAARRAERGLRPDADLERESRADSLRWRDFRRSRKTALTPEEAVFRSLQQALVEGKRDRSALSRALQAEMHEQFSESISSALGVSLETLFPHGIPTGTGDCCAPKLLAWAAAHDLEPLAMAELWWGPTSVGDKVQGEFYPACHDRCQPLMGALLSAAFRPAVGLLYQDQHLLVASKPSGLLTVPGRYPWNQDCLLRRIARRFSEALPVHRLDLETSGVVVLARDPATQAALRRQFEERGVGKVYRARLLRPLEESEGRIEASLGPDPERSGCYRLDSVGRTSVTEFRQVGEREVELRPLTGRSHQLRVHMSQALGNPIAGDRLYGGGAGRLHLHAWKLSLAHPVSGDLMTFECHVPF